MPHAMRWKARLAALACLIGLPGSAMAWDYTPAVISGLTSVYGYLSNQEATLQQGAAKFPALRAHIQQTRAEFDRQYPDALGAVTRLFQDIPLPAPDRARLASKVLEIDRETTIAALASESAMQAYLKRVRDSAHGDMEKATLQLLLAAVYEKRPAAELASPMAQVWRTRSARPGVAVDLTLRMPLSWDRDPAREKLQPDSGIFAFNSQGGNGLATIDLLALPQPADAPDAPNRTKTAGASSPSSRAQPAQATHTASAVETIDSDRIVEQLRALVGPSVKVTGQGTARVANRGSSWVTFVAPAESGRGTVQHGRLWSVPVPAARQVVLLLCRTAPLAPSAAEAERARLEPLWLGVAASLTEPAVPR